MGTQARFICAVVFLCHVSQVYGAVNRSGSSNLRPDGIVPARHRITNALTRITVMTEDGKKCKFPFLFGGRMHFSCIYKGFFLNKWCATTHNHDRDGEGGICMAVSSKEIVNQNHCAKNPCKHHGTCSNALDGSAYHCECPEGFTGHNCEIKKCFDEAHREFYDLEESWARIYEGNVESCKCADSKIECHRGERYTACTRNPCLNEGTCRLMHSTGKTVCGCRGKYVGKYCNIDLTHSCYENGNATKYRGVVKKTQSGLSCLRWNSDLLHQELHIDSVEDYVLKGLGSHSYCRSPDNDDVPWCYVMKNHHMSWEYCNIKQCVDMSRTLILHEDLPKIPVMAVQPSCGKKHEKRVPRGRIVGGLSALPASHPWLAALYIENGFCTGSLVQPCWVVSAAHCFAQSPTKTRIKVVLGQHFFNRSTDVTQTFEVDRYIFHDRYSVFNPTDHDIVLIKLKRKDNRCAKKTQFVQTICLPGEGISFPNDYRCHISGWGHLAENADIYSPTLQEAIIPLVADNKCSSPEVYGAQISENMFCAGCFDCGLDACQGDSGGPLACERDKISYLYGIISWGDGCGRRNKPGVYTKVSNYVNWINQRTMPKKSTD
ncbi:hepatocyte growth factor activator serine protease isoform X2 [Ascaphus truei]|uniref:hepatocyte growth factor activator serine protease isoform X2 n=1 Tax=Ascaphus truei TaxID=8439 RepID=UPI003F5935C3